MRAPALSLLPLLLCGSCASWFFSGLPEVDRSRPVALVETVGGAEHGATTELGVLTLGRAATDGPCRVHYFLGPSPMTEDGTIRPTGSVFHRAAIDLRTQHLRILGRPVTPADALLAMYTPDGHQVVQHPVRLATGEGIAGDLLEDPGVPLPAGTAVLAETPDGLRFVGLIAGSAAWERDGARRRLLVFAGVDRVRELLAVTAPHPVEHQIRHRPDDITVLEPVAPPPPKPVKPPQ